MQKPAKKYFTVQEYLELEESAEYKSEYYKGEIFAMAGASSNHNQIIGNVYSRLHQTINQHNCRVFMSDLRLWIKQRELFTYPDIMIICDKPKFYPDRDDTVVNPLIIIEAISKSTEAYDRSKKFLFYRSIPTFQEYILINQYSPHIEQFYIGAENHWLFKDYNSISDILKFSKIDFEIPLENIYYLVDFKLVENLEA
jgi:Uma2 family endonuclease